MKIAITCPASLPATQFGGILFLAVDIAREVSKKNCDVTIFTTDLDFSNGVNTFNSKLPKIEEFEGFRISRSHVYLKIKLFFINPSIFFQIRKSRPDLIHVIGIRSFQALIGALISKFYNIPLIVSDQGGLFTHPDFKSNITMSVLYKLQEPLIKFIIKHSKRIVVANEYEQMIFSKYCDKSKLVIVRNGVNLEQLKTSSLDFKKKYQISGRIILFLGRFNKVKGIDLLLQAFSDICKDSEFNDVTLVIMGADFGYEKDMLLEVERLKIQNRVRIIKKPPREDVISAYHCCEFAVLPSRWEMSPLTPLEVFSSKKPVISTNVHGIPYTVIHGKNGLLVPPENSKEISNAISILLKDKELCEKLGREGFRMIETELNSKVMGDAIYKIYCSVIDENENNEPRLNA